MKTSRHRTSSNTTEVADKLFFNDSQKGLNPSMRQAAKRFVLTPEFTEDCAYYSAKIENNRWVFRPVGKCMR